MRLRLVVLAGLLASIASGCRDQVVIDQSTVWDLVACSTDDDGFNVLSLDYPPDDLGGPDDVTQFVQSDRASDLGGMGISLARADDERLAAIQTRLDSDPRVLSTHRDSTISEACFSPSASSP